MLLSKEALIKNDTKLHNKNLLIYYFSHIKEPDFNVVKLLIEAGVDVNAKNESERTALIIAAKNGYARIVKLLIEGAHPFIAEVHQLRSEQRGQSYLGQLPPELLTQTMQYVKPPNKADPNITDYARRTALSYAIDTLYNIFGKKSSDPEKIKNYEEIIDILKPITTKK